MPTTLATFKTRLQAACGGRSDTTINSFITGGVNFACIMISLLFDPAELQAVGSITVTGSASSASIASLTGLRYIKAIYNSTGSIPMWHIPLERLSFAVPTTEANAPRFWAREGNTLYIKPAPLVNNTLVVYYTAFPTTITGDTDQVSYTNYDSFIESYALAYVQACLDETDISTVWSTLGNTLLVPIETMQKARDLFERGKS